MFLGDLIPCLCYPLHPPPPPPRLPSKQSERESPSLIFSGKGAAVHWLCFVGSKEYVMCPLR